MEVRLLGQVGLSGADGPLDPGTPQQRCVLAALALTPGNTVTVDALVDRVWGEETPHNVRAVLYTYISRLRGLIERAGGGRGRDVLRHRDGGYALDVDPELVDLHRSRRLATRARAAAARPDGLGQAADLFAQACALWAGAPLTGLRSDWACRMSSGLESERLSLLTERFDTALRTGAHDAVVGPLSEAAAEHPLTEPLARLLMLALYRCGRQADALDVYTRLRRRTVDELGDEPGPVLRRLHEQVLRRDPELDPPPPATGSVRPPTGATPDRSGDSGQKPAAAGGCSGDDGTCGAAAWVVSCQLPPDVAWLAGREEPLGQVVSALDPQAAAASVIMVSGPPGVGKSALANRAAHLVRERFPDGQWFVRLGGADAPRQSEAVLTELLEASGVSPGAVPEDVERRSAALRARLADRRVLLVLDDAADAARIRPLLPGTTGSVVLVTGRHALPGLEGATRVRLGPLPERDAVALLEAMVGAGRVTAEPEAAAAVCAACGGSPLALRVAAARLAVDPGWTLARFSERLRDQSRLLDELSVEDLAVRPGLRVSYAGLDGPGRETLRCLGLLPGLDLAPWAVAVLRGGEGGDPDAGPAGPTAPAGATAHGERLVERLLAASLAESTGADPTGEPRYRLHDLVGTFAGELAGRDTDPEGGAPALRRLCDALLTVADACYRKLHVDTADLPATEERFDAGLPSAEVARLTADPVAWLLAERRLLVAAVERACALGWHRVAADLADRVLTHVLRVHVGPDSIRALYRGIREAAERAGDDLVARRVECRLATETAVAGGLVEAAQSLSECAEAFEQIGAPAEQAFSLAESAKYLQLSGDGAAALPRARRAAGIARGLGGAVELTVRRDLAGALAATGRYREALALLERVVADATGPELVAHRTVGRLALAVTTFAHGDVERAEAECHAALASVDATTDPRGMAYLRLLVGRLAAARGRRGRALAVLDEAVGRFADLGDARGEALARAAAGEMPVASGRPTGEVVASRSAGAAVVPVTASR